MKEISDILTEKELKQLKRKGYTPIRYIGSGHTRDVFEAIYQKKGLKKIRTLKIPKKEIERNICTLINLSKFPKGNPNVDELKCSSEIEYHPNIASVIDVLGVDSRVATVEEYVDGDTLEDLVKKAGPLGRKQFREIFGQLISAVKYLHSGNDPIIHRDIKPSNILVDKKGTVKLTDLQTAKRKNQIKEKIIPTRGGTAYTSPHLLNSLFNGNENKANEETDTHAIVASAFYSLTGENFSDYRVDYDEEGREVQIGDRSVKVSLFKGKDRIETIEMGEYEKNLEKALKKAPKPYRKMLKKYLSFKNQTQKNIHSLEHDLERIDKTQSFKKFMKKYKLAIWASFFLSLCSAIVVVGSKNTRIKEYDHSPTLNELLDSKRYVNMLEADPFTSIATLFQETPTEMLDHLKPYVKELREKMDDKDIKEILDYSEYAQRCGGIQKPKELNALLLSCYFNEKNIYNNERSKNFLVPLNFARASLKQEEVEKWDSLNIQEAAFAFYYLNACEHPGERIEDLFVRYFCNNEEIFEAQKKANCISYFTRFDEQENKFFNGYRNFIDSKKRKLIDNAIAAYLTIDEKGNFREEAQLED